MTVDPRPTIADPDNDPYLWLEELDDEDVMAWVKTQNDKTLKAYGSADFLADRDALAAIYDRSDKIPYVQRRGEWLYNFWTDENNPLGLWRRTSIASFKSPSPKWDVLLDVDALSKEEGETWVFRGSFVLPNNPAKAMLKLSRGGSDAITLREFDIDTRAFVTDGFVLPEAKTYFSWVDEDTLLVASSLGEGMATESGYGRAVRLWRRGSEFEKAPILFETDPKHMYVWTCLDLTRSAETVWYFDAIGFYDEEVHIGDQNGPKEKLDLPTDIEIEMEGDWVVVKRRTPWTIDGVTYCEGTLLGCNLDQLLAGTPKFSVLFEPGERRILESFFWCNGNVVLNILDELNPIFEILKPAEGEWERSRVTGLPETGVIDIYALDAEPAKSNGDLIASVRGPLTPPSMLIIEEGKAPELLKQQPATFDTKGLAVSRYEAISVDGERIPYTVVGPEQKTGNAPVHLYGYGGFEVSMLPDYNSAIGKLWLERGGTSIVANIRGGGEFGPQWHQDGILDRKSLSHDDFAAVAKDLVERGVTKPQRIAAEGGSNGGLLIANMLTRYPECFGALFCSIPLIDMRRYNKLLAGASWVAEYGDPDDEEDWAFIQKLSAYHVAQSGQAYPPILFATTSKDDRVHPGHARKMTAKLQALGYEAYLYESSKGGHGAGTTSQERAEFTALGLKFLREKIGGF